MASIGRPTGHLPTTFENYSDQAFLNGASPTVETPHPQPSAPPNSLFQDPPPPYSFRETPRPAVAPPSIQPSSFLHDGIQDALFTACETQDLNLIEQMIARGADVNAKKIYPPFTESGKAYHEIKSPLIIVSQLGNLKAAQMLIQAGALIQVKGEIQTQGILNRYRIYNILLHEATVLHAACYVPSSELNHELVVFLISAGADVNPKAKSSISALIKFFTPLHILCNRTDNEKTIDLLIRHGAKLEDDFPYISNAIRTHHSKECIESLLKAGASANHKSPISEAAKQGLIETAELLLHHGAEINIDKNSPLQTATTNNQIPMMKWLLQKGANPSISFELDSRDYPEIWDKINATKSEIYSLKMPLLMYAAIVGNVEMVTLLLNSKADTKAKATYKKYNPSSNHTLSLLNAVSLLTPPETKTTIAKLLRQHGASEDCTIS